MKCPNCSFNNIASAKECKICGTGLEPVEGANNDTLALDEALKAIFAGKIRNDEILTDSLPHVAEPEEEQEESAWEPLSEESEEGDASPEETRSAGDTQPLSRRGRRSEALFAQQDREERRQADGQPSESCHEKQGLFINPLLDTPSDGEEEEEAPSGTPGFIPVYERTDESIRIEDKAENLVALQRDPADDLPEIPARRRRSKADEIAAIALVVLIICLAALIYVAIKMAKSPEAPVIISEHTTTETSSEFVAQVDTEDFLNKLESYLKNGSETAALKFFLNPVKANDALKPIRELQPVSIRFDRVQQDEQALRFEAEIENIDQEIRYKRTVRFQVTFADRSSDMETISHDFDPETDGTLRQEIGQVPTSEGENATEEKTTTVTTTTTTERIPFDESYFTRSGSLSGGSGTEADTLRKVRMGDHLYFHRFVFDFLGEKAPYYTVSLLDGGLVLQVNVSNITEFTADYALTEWSYLAKSIQIVADTPNSIQIQITMNEPVMMYTYTLDDPGRIVIDIRGESSED